jgi:hypothetical protein
MNDALEKYFAVLGLIFFVISSMVLIRVAEKVEAGRQARYQTCRIEGGPKLICGLKSAFGVTRDQN